MSSVKISINKSVSQIPSLHFQELWLHTLTRPPFPGLVLSRKIPEGGGVLPYISHIGMCGPKGCGFLAVLVWNRVYILTILV